MQNTQEKYTLKWIQKYQTVSHKPGVYWFLGPNKKVLYVGKAKDLKNRLSSYTQLNQVYGKTKNMVLEAVDLRYAEQESELLALLVEAELIRLHQPQYNILLKDDKTPLYVYITRQNFPEIKTVRKKDLMRLRSLRQISEQDVFGPYQSTQRTQEILRLIRPIFRWCEHPRQDNDFSKAKACFYFHIRQCSGACVGLISQDEYQQMVKQLTQFMKGKTKEVINFFKKQMLLAADTQEYERAARYRDQASLIRNLIRPSFQLAPELKLPKLQESLAQEGIVFLRRQISEVFPLPKEYHLNRIEGFDVSNIMGKNAAVSMVTFADGKPDKAQYRLFNIYSTDTPNDYLMMKEAVARRQNHPEWGIPDLVVIDGGKGQLRAALSVWQWSTPVVSLVKKPDRLVIPVFLDPKKKSVKGLGYHIIQLPEGHPSLLLLQQIRDESHRFAKKQHTRLRNRNLIKS